MLYDRHNFLQSRIGVLLGCIGADSLFLRLPTLSGVDPRNPVRVAIRRLEASPLARDAAVDLTKGSLLDSKEAFSSFEGSDLSTDID